MAFLRYGELLARRISLTRAQIRKDLTAFASVASPCELIIDVGSGPHTPYRDLLGAQNYWGIDVYQPAHVNADGSHIPCATSTADAVVCTEVLEHLPDPDSALSEMHRVLKKGGYLIVTVPLLWGEHDRTDFHRWTEAGLRKLLAQAGFSVVFLKRRGGVFSAMGCLIAQIPRQIFGSLGQQKSWFTKLPYILTLVPAMAMPWLMLPLDLLDRNRNFVIGYSVLCRKSC